MSEQRVVWESYPSWRQFAWLYLVSLLALWRAALIWPINTSVGLSWLAGAMALVLCAAILRRWGHYELATQEVRIRNGYTGRTISALALAELEAVEVWQGPIATMFGIGTVLLRNRAGQTIRFRGVADPEQIKARIDVARAVSGTDQVTARVAK